MEMNNILKIYYLLFSKNGTPRKRAGVRTPWTPPRSAPVNSLPIGLVITVY